MKNNIKVVLLVTLVVFSFAGTCNLVAKVLSVESNKLLRESREGRNIIAINEKAKKDLMDLELKESQKISKARENLENEMRLGKLSDEDIQEKYQGIGRIQRKAKHSVEMAREEFEVEAQKRVLSFRKKALDTARDFCAKQGGEIMFDKSSVGIIYTAKSVDQTSNVLKVLNSQYGKEKAKSALTKK